MALFGARKGTGQKPKVKTLTVHERRCPQNHVCPAVSVCPAGALSQTGYHAPVADQGKCIRCGKCVKFCPMKALILE